MWNREYRDLRELRRDVVTLILEGRYEFNYHAENTHTEIPRETKIQAILKGRQDQPNHRSRADEASYVCWRRHRRFGLLRAVYAVREDAEGPHVFVISVFQEEGRREAPR